MHQITDQAQVPVDPRVSLHSYLQTVPEVWSPEWGTSHLCFICSLSSSLSSWPQASSACTDRNTQRVERGGDRSTSVLLLFFFSLSPAPPPSRPLHLLLEEWVWKDKMLHQQQPSGVSAGEPQVSETQRPPQPPRHRPTLQVIDQMGLVQMPGLLRWLIRQAVHTMCSVCCGFKSSLLYLWRLSDFSDSP